MKKIFENCFIVKGFRYFTMSKALYCSNCGQENIDQSIYCSNCGMQFKETVVKPVYNDGTTDTSPSAASFITDHLLASLAVLIALLALVLVLHVLPSLAFLHLSIGNPVAHL